MGYDKAYNEAKQRRHYYNLGEEKGYELLALDTLLKDIPTDYQEVFTNGHKNGSDKKNEELLTQAEEKGYSDGRNLAEKNTSYTDDKLQEAYDTEYKKGYESKLYAIKFEGHDAAFENDELTIPSEYENNEEAVAQYTKGFNENSEAVQIKEADNDGARFLINNKVKAAAPYEHANELYDLYNEQGKEDSIIRYKMIGKGCGFALTFGVATTLILKRRRRKKSV